MLTYTPICNMSVYIYTLTDPIYDSVRSCWHSLITSNGQFFIMVPWVGSTPTIVASGICSIVSDGPVYRSLNAYWPTGGRKSLILYLSLTITWSEPSSPKKTRLLSYADVCGQCECVMSWMPTRHIRAVGTKRMSGSFERIFFELALLAKCWSGKGEGASARGGPSLRG